MQQHDVERIVRDVLSDQALSVALLHVEPTADGWHVTFTDVAGRVMSTELLNGRPAEIRDAMTHWAENWS